MFTFLCFWSLIQHSTWFFWHIGFKIYKNIYHINITPENAQTKEAFEKFSIPLWYFSLVLARTSFSQQRRLWPSIRYSVSFESLMLEYSAEDGVQWMGSSVQLYCWHWWHFVAMYIYSIKCFFMTTQPNIIIKKSLIYIYDYFHGTYA